MVWESLRNWGLGSLKEPLLKIGRVLWQTKVRSGLSVNIDMQKYGLIPVVSTVAATYEKTKDGITLVITKGDLYNIAGEIKMVVKYNSTGDYIKCHFR